MIAQYFEPQLLGSFGVSKAVQNTISFEELELAKALYGQCSR